MEKSELGFIAQELQDAEFEGENELLDPVYEANPERLEIKLVVLFQFWLNPIQI